jgi:hypothetical protein
MATHTPHFTEQKKLDGPVSQIGGSDLGRWAPTASFQIPGILIFKIGCFNFYWLVFTGQFLGDNYKSFPLPHLKAAGATHEIHSS